MKHWPTKALGELLTVQNGFAFKSELFNDKGKGIPIIRIRDLERGFSETFYDGEYDTSFEVKKGDFLIGMDGEFRCYRWQGGKGLLNQRVCRLQKFSRNLKAAYVFYGINDDLQKIENNTAFATVKHLSSKQIASIKMPVPPLAEQERIVKLLDEADELRKLRTKANSRTAVLIPALFHEIFGDRGSRGSWPVVRVGDICEVKGGKRLPKGEEYAEEPTPYRYIRVRDINEGWINETALRFLKPETQRHISRYTVKEGDLIITIAGTIGVVAPVGASVSGANLTENAAKLVPRYEDKYDVVFLSELMQTATVQKQIGLRTGQVTIGKLALFRIEQISFPLPPLELQKKFAKDASEIRRMEAEQAMSRQRLENLFQSMLYGAFSGEL
jgi:type I restriction enzyme S subunit